MNSREGTEGLLDGTYKSHWEMIYKETEQG